MHILGKAATAAATASMLLAGPIAHAAHAAPSAQPRDDDGQNPIYTSDRSLITFNLINYSNNDSIVETERVVNIATDRGEAATEKEAEG